MKISHSQIAQWQKCQQAYKYSYVDFLESKTIQDHFVIGTLIHAGLEAYFLGKDYVTFIEKASTAACEKTPDFTRNIKSHKENAIAKLEMFKEWFKIGDWEVLFHGGSPMVEYRFDKEIDGIRFTGQFDLVARHKRSDRVFVFDHKTRSKFKNEEQEHFNLQFIIYQKVLAEMGIQCAGTAILQVKSDEFDTPKINKDGSLSKAKISTTWERYQAHLKEHGLDDFDYEEMKDKLGSIEWFNILKIYRSPLTIDKVFKDVIVPTVHEIIRAKNENKFVRNLQPFSCGFCQYQPICHGELEGHDIENLVSLHYKKKGKVEVNDGKDA